MSYHWVVQNGKNGKLNDCLRSIFIPGTVFHNSVVSSLDSPCKSRRTWRCGGSSRPSTPAGPSPAGPWCRPSPPSGSGASSAKPLGSAWRTELLRSQLGDERISKLVKSIFYFLQPVVASQTYLPSFSLKFNLSFLDTKSSTLKFVGL